MEAMHSIQLPKKYAQMFRKRSLSKKLCILVLLFRSQWYPYTGEQTNQHIEMKQRYAEVT